MNIYSVIYADYTNEANNVSATVPGNTIQDVVSFMKQGFAQYDANYDFRIKEIRLLDNVDRDKIDGDFLEHAHHWKAKYITVDSVDCFSGVECSQCELFLSPDALVDIVGLHPNSLLITLYAVPQREG